MAKSEKTKMSTNDIKFSNEKTVQFLYPLKFDEISHVKRMSNPKGYDLWSGKELEISIDESKVSKCFFDMDLQCYDIYSLERNEDSDEMKDKETDRLYDYGAQIYLRFEKMQHVLQNVDFEVTLKLQREDDESLFGSKLRDYYDDTLEAHVNVCLSKRIDVQSKCVFSVKLSYKDQLFDRELLHLSDVKKLYGNEDNLDIKITVENQVFNAHKVILSFRSTVLAKMIKDINMLKEENGEIILENIKPSVMAELLAYIYTGTCKLNEAPNELFKWACHFELPNLQKLCIDYLFDNLNYENVAKVLLLTKIYDLCELTELEVKAGEFILNSGCDVEENEDFQKYLRLASVNMYNLVMILKLAERYKVKELFNKAFECIKLNYDEVFDNTECKEYLSAHGDLTMELFKYSLKPNKRGLDDVAEGNDGKKVKN